MNIFTLCVGPWVIGVEDPGRFMTIFPRKIRDKIPGSIPAVLGVLGFPGRDTPVIIVDLRILFGESTSETDGSAFIFKGPDMHLYGLVFDQLGEQLALGQKLEDKDGVLLLPEHIQPFIKTALVGHGEGFERKIFVLNLEVVLNKETLKI